ncbi:MAG: hypothetical protein OEL87_00635 [Nanoarchaeota archaeon]|nr:hypothetical protein [Nanoarchaeota archaeon]
MKKIFRKAITVLGSAALIGMTVGAASAASYPTPFTSNTAIVVGANAAPSDNIAASSVASNLDAASTTTAVTTLTGATGVTEDEVALGGNISTTTAGATSKITATLTDSKIDSLLDTKISWDDGGASGADDYNIHEEIIVGDTSIKTTFDDNDFAELLAMTNDKSIEYRYVFDDAFNVTGVGTTNADDLYLTLLGKQYEIDAMTATSITVVTSEKVSLAIGESVTVDGKTFTVDDIFDGSVQVNGEIITTSNTKKIGGIQVNVDSVGYHANSPELSKTILKIGKDITKTYSDGEEYIGEDEDDPMWVWSISDPSTAAGYIGVKYNQKQTRDTDDVVYEGGSYMLPENFGEVKFEGTTDVTYEDFKIYFDDAEDLWNSTDLTSTAQTQDAPVLVIESVDGTKDAIQLSTASQETSKMYLRWAAYTAGTEANTTDGALEVFYSDVDGTVQDAIKPRYSTKYNAANTSTTTVSTQDIGDLIVGDTTVAMNASVTNGNLRITFIDGEAAQPFTVDVGGVNLTATAGSLKWFGADVEATDKEDGLAGDLLVAGTSVGTYDNDIMTTNGQIIKTPESNLDNDEVIFSVPSDRVFAKVSVVAGGDAATTTEAGVMTVMDNAVSSVAGKNLIVIGGSAINSVAADLLGSAYAGAAFTSATGVASGEFLIQSFDRAGKTALLVAGYNAADTEKAVTYLLNNDVDTTVGMKMKGTSATEATVVTA